MVKYEIMLDFSLFFCYNDIMPTVVENKNELSEKLCELCGVSPLFKVKQSGMLFSENNIETKIVQKKIYPDFRKMSNLINLYNIRYGKNCLGFFVSNKYKLTSKNSFIEKVTILAKEDDKLRLKIRQQKWEYL